MAASGLLRVNSPPSAQAHAAASVSGSRAMAPAAASVVLFRVAVAASRCRLSHHKSASIRNGQSCIFSCSYFPSCLLFKETKTVKYKKKPTGLLLTAHDIKITEDKHGKRQNLK
ncbi:hypothetical protein RR48_05674 [Papilio machaon]|uniref:Uncharacterized protein n=1 Tax=Papilio machaon TaxID=76193 RepID=A0A0N1PGU9_PAPMA|nr:hypothetical protein RR48_05674 [Papilio machaon]